MLLYFLPYVHKKRFFLVTDVSILASTCVNKKSGWKFFHEQYTFKYLLLGWSICAGDFSLFFTFLRPRSRPLLPLSWNFGFSVLGRFLESCWCVTIEPWPCPAAFYFYAWVSVRTVTSFIVFWLKLRFTFFYSHLSASKQFIFLLFYNFLPRKTT